MTEKFNAQAKLDALRKVLAMYPEWMQRVAREQVESFSGGHHD